MTDDELDHRECAETVTGEVPFPDETERCCEDECTAPAEVFPGGNDKPGYCQRCWTRSLQGEQW